MPTHALLAITLEPFWTSALHLEASHRKVVIDILTAGSLMEAYDLAEHRAPAYAVVDPAFAALPEFYMIKTMFNALGTRWMVIGTRTHGMLRADQERSGQMQLAKEVLDFVCGKRTAEVAPRRLSRSGTGKVVVLGASTGGVEALSRILPLFQPDCPPTVIVQHTGTHFGSNLVDLLDRNCKASVARVRHGETLSTGMIRIAAGIETHCHLSQSNGFITNLINKDPVSGHLPSVDELFQSAVPFAHQVVAGVLTGMGQDGADGLLKLRRAGAKTFCQDKNSSVVYGMPRIAWETGAAQSKVPLDLIASHIARNC